MLLPVIMSGGSGTRLWPQSRKTYPKQFLNLTGDGTMIQETVRRLNGLDVLSPLVICNESHRFVVAEQLQQIGISDSQLILEPVGRNTAPAIAVAAIKALKKYKDPMLLVLAADHVIDNKEIFHKAVLKAEELAKQDKLVTFGIVPSGPETGYGYIERGDKLHDGAFDVKKFVEKPDKQTAEGYIESGEYLWNSGMFLFKAKAYLDELKLYRSDIYEASVSSVESIEDEVDFCRLDADDFGKCPAESVDIAVMEKTKKAVVVSLDAGWSDIGSWATLWEIGDKDENQNVVIGDVITNESENSYIHSSHRLVTTIGVSDLVIIETADALLVAKKDKVQKVKDIVTELNNCGRGETDIHRKVPRPWGDYDCIDKGERFQVKRIIVKPGACLSLQMHHHRAEHWIVVKGTAQVTKDDEIFTLSENQSTYIPLGVKHRLENPGVVPLEIIEVQSGSYLGEDDIVRFDDTYGRK